MVNFKIYPAGYDAMLTKSELLRNKSKELCWKASPERAEAERVRAAAKEARALSQPASQNQGERRIAQN